MCPLPDFNGKDENAAGTDYGAIGMFRSCFGSNRCISAFRGICRGGSIGAIVRLWQLIYRNLHGWIYGNGGRNLCCIGICLSGIPDI